MSFPKYPKYNLTGLTWLCEAPEHWRLIAPKRVMRSCSGGTLIKGECAAEPEEGLFPAFSASGQDVWIGRPDYSSPGIVLSAVGARCGKTFKADGEWGVVANTHCLFPGDSEDRDYFWYLTNKEDWWEIGGTAQPFVKVKETLSRPWCLPPVSEQRAIATFLDRETAKIDSLIAEQKRLIELLQEKRQAVISHAVTKGLNPDAPMKDSGVEWLGEVPDHWEVKPLKRLGCLIAGFAFKSADFAKEGVRVLKIANIQTRFLDLEDEAYVNEQIAKQAADYTIKPGDLLFALTRPIISSGIKVAISDKDGMLLNQRNAIFRLEDKYKDSNFIYHLIFAKNFETEFNSWIDRTGQQPNISTTSIGNISIPIPPAKEMEAIGKHLDSQEIEFESIISNARKMMTLLTEKRTALVSAAVTGQIDVRGLAPAEEVTA